MRSFALPWQKPGLMGFVLAGQPLLPTPMDRLQRTAFAETGAIQEHGKQDDESEVHEEEVIEEVPALNKPRARVILKAKAAPNKRIKAYKEQDDNQRRRKLLGGWEQVVARAPSRSQTGMLMTRPEEAPAEVVRLTLVDKATNTLAARLSAVTAYINWMPAESYWPPTERAAYEFIDQTANISAPATRATRFLEALGFMQGAFGFDFQDLLMSRRLSGFCAEQSDRLAPRRQSPTLPLWTVKALELRLIDNDFDEDEAIVAGAILLMLSLRARFSDFRSIVQVSVSKNLIEVEVNVTKTFRKVSSGLPVILRGPRLLTTGQDWWPSYDAARIRAGIPFPRFPLFPCKADG